MSKKLNFMAMMLLGILLSINQVWGALSPGDVYTKVTDISSLSDGDEVIFVNAGGTSAMSTTQNKNNRGSVSITTSNGSWKCPTPAPAVQVLVVKIPTSGKYGFHTGSGYLYSASSSDNYLKTTTTAISTAPTTTSLWTLAIAASGNTNKAVTIKNGTNTSYYIQWNSSTVSQYKNTQTDGCIYKKASAAVPYTVTFKAGSNGSCSTESLTEASAGAGVTLPNVTANTGYRFAGWSTSSTPTSADAGIAGAKYKPSANCTLYAYYVKTWDVKWYVNGVATTKTVDNGAALEIPDDIDTDIECGGKVFVGWCTQASYSNATTAPTGMFTSASGTVDANANYYAVFATASAGGADPTAYTAGNTGSYVLAIYNTSDSKWYALPTSPTVTSGKITGEEITVSTTASSVNYVTSANASGYTWTIANATNGQTISDGTNYIYHSNGGSSGTNLAYGNSTSYTWKIKSEINGLTFKGMSGSTVNSRGMLASGTSFGGYALSNEDQNGYYRIQVLPIGGGSTYTDYLTECAEPTACATPTFSPVAGNYATGAQSVTISCTTDGATIYYTTNGDNPTTSSATYSSAINVDRDMTIKAIAVKGGMDDSELAEAAYTITYPISFNLNGKTATVPTTQNISYNGTASKPTDPDVTGYTFGGWYAEAGCTNAYNFSTGVTAAKELFAKWTPTEYAITYNDLNGATNSNPANYTIETATIALADPGERSGCVFAGWYTGSNGTGDKVTEIALGSTGARILYANWKASYTIIWMCSGTEYTRTNVIQGDGLAMPSTDIDLSTTCGDGYVVRGWTKATSVNSNGTSIVYAANGDAVSGPETYYAVIAKQEGDASEDFVITTTSLANGDYVIGYQYNTGTKIVMSNQSRGTNNEWLTAIQVAPAGSPLKYKKDAENINNNRIWTITKHTTESTYSIQNKENGKYVNLSTSAVTLGNTPQYFNITWDNSNSRWLIESTTNTGYYLVGYVNGTTYYFQSKQGSLGTGYKISLFKSASTATYSDYRLVCCVKMAAPASLNSTPTEDGATISWGSVTGATGYEVKIDGGAWTSAGVDVANRRYTITGKDCGGATVTWQVRATCNTGDYCEEGIACAEQNFQTLACTCPSFSFHWDNGTEWTKDCFTSVGGNAWAKDGLTIPATDKNYWVGYQEKYACESECPITKLNNENAVSENVAFKYMPIAYLQESNSAGEGSNLKHAMAGAYGSVRIYDNSGSKNLYAGFIPAGYLLRMGTNGLGDWTSTNFTTQNTTAVTYETDLVTIGSADAGKNIYVGLWTAATFNAADGGATVNNWTNGYAISSCKVSNGNASQYASWGTLGTLTENKTGKFRFWYNNGNYNGDLHFVPYYNVTFKRGETVLSTTELKSCEVANVVDMTAPSLGSEETFDGWYEDAGLTVKFDGETYDASANGSKTFYAKVSTKTYSITLNAGTGTISGESHFDFAKGAQTLPVAVPCDAAVANGWSFAGWATASVGTQTASKPSGLVEPVAGSCSYTVAGEAELFAVYQKTESDVPTGEFKLSVVNSSNSTTYYVGPISSTAKYFLAKTSASDGVVFGVEDNKIYYWSGSNKVYIKCANSSDVEGVESANASEWTITADETNFSAKRTISDKERYIGFNYNNGSTPRFAAYTDSYSHVLTKHDVKGENTVYCSTLSCETTYAITVNSAEGGAPKSDKTRAAENATVTLTPAADGCHDFVSWKVYKTGDESTEVTVTDNTFTMPAYDVTVEATYSAKTYTITLHEGTTTTVVSDLVCGATYDFPALSADCSAKVNGLGWTKTVPKGDKTWDSEPTSVVTSITVSETADYYAVYAEDDDSGAGTYMPTTTITDGGRYLIVYTDEPKAMKSNYGNNGFGETSLTSGLGSMLSGATANEVWVFKKESNSKYSIRNLSSGKYVGSDAQGLTLSNDVQAVWSITANSSCATITTGDAYVVYNTGAYPFTGFYSNSSNIKLYTTVGAAKTYSNENPCANYHTITITTPEHGTVETTPQNKAKDGETITITSTPATHYTVTEVAVAADCETVEVTDGVFTMPDCDVTITVTFTEKTLYTVTLVDEMHNTTIPNGHGTQTGYEGEGTKVAFESLSDQVVTDDQKVNGTCKEKHYHFVGWILSTEELADDGSNVIRATRKDVVITGDATYKAVWAERVND